MTPWDKLIKFGFSPAVMAEFWSHLISKENRGLFEGHQPDLLWFLSDGALGLNNWLALFYVFLNYLSDARDKPGIHLQSNDNTTSNTVSLCVPELNMLCLLSHYIRQQGRFWKISLQIRSWKPCLVTNSPDTEEGKKNPNESKKSRKANSLI